KQIADSTAYVANMNLAGSEFEKGSHQRINQLLDIYLPVNDVAKRQNDLSHLRSFYWYYLWRQNIRDYDLEGHKYSVTSVAFSPDGRTLASASADQTVKLWDVQSRKEIKTLEGHKDYVLSVAFSPDGRTLASASGDRTVRLWTGASDEDIDAFRPRK